MKRFAYSLLTFISVATLAATPKIETREINYKVNGATFKGFLALPEGKNKVPGVLVIHEWWGHNEYARKRARMLAELGYAAFALDMYGEGKSTNDPKVAGHMMNETISSGQIKARFDGAMKVLKDEPRVEQDKIAAIGYCFGGNVVLSMAEASEPLKAVVSFHGSYPAHAELKKGSVKSEVLVLHGAEDQFTTKEALEQLKKDLDAAGAKYKVVIYPGAKHAFSDPESSAKGEMHHIPIGYNKEADLKSWDEMKKLFKKTL